MHDSKRLPGSICALLGVCAGVAIGCGEVDQSFDDASLSESRGAETEALRAARWHHRPPAGTGGSATGGTSSAAGTGTGTAGSGAAGSSGQDCGICAVTQSCCEAVNAGALCTFSSDTCASLDPQRQAYYANYCLTVLRTITSAQTINGRAAPLACSSTR